MIKQGKKMPGRERIGRAALESDAVALAAHRFIQFTEAVALAGPDAELIGGRIVALFAEADPNGSKDIPQSISRATDLVAAVVSDVVSTGESADEVASDLTYGHEVDPCSYQSLPEKVLAWAKRRAAYRVQGLADQPLAILGNGEYAREVR